MDHHGYGDVVVIIKIFGLVSILLKDRVEGVVTDDLSEGFESDRLNGIESISWTDLKANGVDLIDWNSNELRFGIEIILLGGLGLHQVASFWSLRVGFLLLIEVDKALNGIVELLVKDSLFVLLFSL